MILSYSIIESILLKFHYFYKKFKKQGWVPKLDKPIDLKNDKNIMNFKKSFEFFHKNSASIEFVKDG